MNNTVTVQRGATIPTTEAPTYYEVDYYGYNFGFINSLLGIILSVVLLYLLINIICAIGLFIFFKIKNKKFVLCPQCNKKIYYKKNNFPTNCPYCYKLLTKEPTQIED